jgi:bacterioferritin-associated ferredoxin
MDDGIRTEDGGRRTVFRVPTPREKAVIPTKGRNLNRNQHKNHKPMNPNTIICTCNEITFGEIEKAIHEKKLKTIEEVGNETTAGTMCGGCVDEIYLLLEKINGKVEI